MAEKKEEKKSVGESKVIEGFKLGFGFYVAFLTGTVILGILTSLIWWLLLAIR
jgi:hypothetical protein